MGRSLTDGARQEVLRITGRWRERSRAPDVQISHHAAPAEYRKRPRRCPRDLPRARCWRERRLVRIWRIASRAHTVACARPSRPSAGHVRVGFRPPRGACGPPLRVRPRQTHHYASRGAVTGRRWARECADAPPRRARAKQTPQPRASRDAVEKVVCVLSIYHIEDIS